MSASSASVTFPTAGVVEDALLDVKIMQREYRHDIAVYRAPTDAGRAYYKAGTPVQVDWARDRETASFHGFVHHLEPTRDGLMVWCKGASSRFDNALRASYYHRTVTSVASEIARQLNFDADITPHGRVFDALTSTGRTWQFLVDYAKEIGFSFYAKNTRLLMHPRTQTLDRYMGQAPILHQAAMGELAGTLTDFAPLDGAAPAGEFRHDNVFTGVDRRTGRPFQVVSGPAAARLGKKQYTSSGQTFHDLSLSTPEEARWTAVAYSERDRYNLRATATAAGSPRVHQTWPVLLSGVDEPYLGAWFVHAVTHHVVPDGYTMDLELGRDGRGPGADAPDVRARRVVATRNTPQGRPKSAYPPSTLVNGQWRSQWSAATRTFGGG